jgi:hypothetical protein
MGSLTRGRSADKFKFCITSKGFSGGGPVRPSLPVHFLFWLARDSAGPVSERTSAL